MLLGIFFRLCQQDFETQNVFLKTTRPFFYKQLSFSYLPQVAKKRC